MKDEPQERAPSSLLPTLMGHLGLPTTQHSAEPSALHTRIDTLQKQASLETLLHALDDKDESVRATAVRVLEQWGKQVPRERIVACLHDDSWLVREAAIVTLHAWEEPIDSALLNTDENPYVRETTHLYTRRSKESRFSAHALSRLLFQSLQGSTEGQKLMRKIQNGETQQDESEEIIFTNIDDGTIVNTTNQERTRKKSQMFLRVTEGIVAALVIFGLVGTWLTFMQHEHSTSTTHTLNATPLTSYVLLNQHFQNPISTPSWSADDKYVLAIDSKNQVYAWDIATGILRKTFVLPFKPSDTGGTWEWSFAPDARYLVVANQQGEIQIWDAVAGRMVIKDTTHAGTWPTWEWSTDGSSRVIIGSYNGNGTAQIWYANSGKRGISLNNESLKNIRYFAWSPNGQYIALFTAASSPTQPIINGMVQIWDTSTGKEVQHFSDGGDTGTILWSPDSTYILTASNKFSKNTTIRVWDALTGQKRLTYTGHTAVPSPLQFSANGTRVLSISTHETLVWNVSTGHTTLNIPRLDTNSTIPSLSPDGSLLEVITQDNTLQIWNTDVGRIVYTYKNNTDTIAVSVPIVWSPNGKYLGFVSSRGKVQMLNTFTGIVLPVSNTPSDATQYFVWSSDNIMLAVSSNTQLEVLQAPG